MKFIANFQTKWQAIFATTKFGSHFLLTLLTNMILAVMALVSGLIAARLLGPTGRGELAAIETWPTFLAVVGSLGISEALVYYSARIPNQAGKWLSTSILSALVTSIPFVIIGYLFMPSLLASQSSEIINASRQYLWLLPIMAVLGMLPHPLRGRDDLFAWNFVRILPSIVWVLILIYCSIQQIDNPKYIAYFYLIGLVLLILPTVWIVLRRIPAPYSPSIDYLKPMLKYGLPSMLSSLPYNLNLKLDKMIMAGFLGPKSLGLYVVAVAWSGAIIPLITAMPSVMLPRVAGESEKSRQNSMLAQSTRLGFFLSIVFATLLAAVTRIFFPIIFGQQYTPAVPSAIILSFASGILGVNLLLETGLMSLGKPKYVMLAELVGLLVTVILLSLLLKPYQILGAAIASFVSYSILSVILVLLVSRETKISWNNLLILRREDLQLVGSKVFTIIGRDK